MERMRGVFGVDPNAILVIVCHAAFLWVAVSLVSGGWRLWWIHAFIATAVFLLGIDALRKLDWGAKIDPRAKLIVALHAALALGFVSFAMGLPLWLNIVGAAILALNAVDAAAKWIRGKITQNDES